MEGVWSLKPDTTQNAPLENWPPNAIIQRCSIYPLRVYRQNRFLVELFFIWRWDAQLKICSRTGLLMQWSSTAPSVHWGFTVKTDFLLNRSSFGDGMHNLKYADARKLASWCCDPAPLCHSTERSLRNFFVVVVVELLFSWRRNFEIKIWYNLQYAARELACWCMIQRQSISPLRIFPHRRIFVVEMLFDWWELKSWILYNLKYAARDRPLDAMIQCHSLISTEGLSSEHSFDWTVLLLEIVVRPRRFFVHRILCSSYLGKSQCSLHRKKYMKTNRRTIVTMHIIQYPFILLSFVTAH